MNKGFVEIKVFHTCNQNTNLLFVVDIIAALQTQNAQPCLSKISRHKDQLHQLVLSDTISSRPDTSESLINGGYSLSTRATGNRQPALVHTLGETRWNIEKRVLDVYQMPNTVIKWQHQLPSNLAIIRSVSSFIRPVWLYMYAWQPCNQGNPLGSDVQDESNSSNVIFFMVLPGMTQLTRISPIYLG